MLDSPNSPIKTPVSTAGGSQTTQGLTNCCLSDSSDNNQNNSATSACASLSSDTIIKTCKDQAPKREAQSENKNTCDGVEISAEEAIKGMPESEMSLAALKASIVASKEMSAASPMTPSKSSNNGVALSNKGTDNVKGTVNEMHRSRDSQRQTSQGPSRESDIDSSAPNSPRDGVS